MKYKEMKNDSPDASDAYATDATAITTIIIKKLKNSILYQGMNIMLLSSKALKAICGNGDKQLKVKQETQMTTWAIKTAETAIKQIATQ